MTGSFNATTGTCEPRIYIVPPVAPPPPNGNSDSSS